MYALVHALAHDLQDLKGAARQARNFGNDKHVGGLGLRDDITQGTGAPIILSAGGVLKKQRGVQTLIRTILDDSMPLVCNVLGIRRDTEIGKYLGHGVQIVRLCKLIC